MPVRPDPATPPWRAAQVFRLLSCIYALGFQRMVLSPHGPEELGALGFPIHYRGHHLHVRISGKGAEVSVDPRDMPPVVIECRGRVEQLEPGRTIRFPAST
jgi:trehalose/maltose hydrolase-like predicted phosphorylase